MHSCRPEVVDDNPAALDVLWRALEPEPFGPAVRIRAVMISSVDGTTAVDGLSGPLGTPTDRLVYDAMRARADVVLVGSGTALDEGYGPATVAPVWTDRRDRTEPPPVIVLTRNLDDALLDHCAKIGSGMQIAAAAETPPARIAAARSAGVCVHVMGKGPFAQSLRDLLAELGAGEVTFEGGPRLLADFVTQGLVDELVLTVSPEIIVGGRSPGLVPSHTLHRVPMRVAAAFSCPRGGLYTRWVVDHGGRNEPAGGTVSDRTYGIDGVDGADE